MQIINLTSFDVFYYINGICQKKEDGKLVTVEQRVEIDSFISNGQETSINSNKMIFKIKTSTGELVDLPDEEEGKYYLMENLDNFAREAASNSNRRDIVIVDETELIEWIDSEAHVKVLSMKKLTEIEK